MARTFPSNHMPIKISNGHLMFYNVAAFLSIISFAMIVVMFSFSVWVAVEIGNSFNTAIKFWNKVYAYGERVGANSAELFEEWRANQAPEIYKNIKMGKNSILTDIGMAMAFLASLFRQPVQVKQPVQVQK